MQSWVLFPEWNSSDLTLVVSPISNLTPSAGSVLGQARISRPLKSRVMAHVLKGRSFLASKNLRINLALSCRSCKTHELVNKLVTAIKRSLVCWIYCMQSKKLLLTFGLPCDMLKRAMLMPASISLMMSGTVEVAGLYNETFG